MSVLPCHWRGRLAIWATVKRALADRVEKIERPRIRPGLREGEENLGNVILAPFAQTLKQPRPGETRPRRQEENRL
jgi:hypothetical protein